MAAAVAPASSPTPSRIGHTALVRVLRTARLDRGHANSVWRVPTAEQRRQPLSLRLTNSRTKNCSRENCSTLSMSPRMPRSSARNAVRRSSRSAAGCEQVLVGDHLPRGGEQQRRHRLVAAHPVLRDVLTTDAERQLGQVLLVDLGGRVPQHVGDDLVGLDERPQHRAGDQRPLGPQHRVDLVTAGGDVLLPVVVPRHLLGDVLAERRGVGEVELELQQIAQPHRLRPERLEPIAFGAAGVHQRQLDDRRLEEGVDQGVAVERGLVLVLGGDAPDRFAAAVDPGDGVPAGQRVDRRPHAVGGAQPQRAVGHRGLACARGSPASPAACGAAGRASARPRWW